jgi:hypothetical protein
MTDEPAPSTGNVVTNHPVSSSTLGAGAVLVAILNLANVTLTQQQMSSLLILVAALPALITAGIGWYRKTFK